jgi:hypothetical protein
MKICVVGNKNYEKNGEKNNRKEPSNSARRTDRGIISPSNER